MYKELSEIVDFSKGKEVKFFARYMPTFLIIHMHLKRFGYPDAPFKEVYEKLSADYTSSNITFGNVGKSLMYKKIYEDIYDLTEDGFIIKIHTIKDERHEKNKDIFFVKISLDSLNFDELRHLLNSVDAIKHRFKSLVMDKIKNDCIQFIVEY